MSQSKYEHEWRRTSVDSVEEHRERLRKSGPTERKGFAGILDHFKLTEHGKRRDAWLKAWHQSEREYDEILLIKSAERRKKTEAQEQIEREKREKEEKRFNERMEVHKREVEAARRSYESRIAEERKREADASIARWNREAARKSETARYEKRIQDIGEELREGNLGTARRSSLIKEAEELQVEIYRIREENLKEGGLGDRSGY